MFLKYVRPFPSKVIDTAYTALKRHANSDRVFDNALQRHSSVYGLMAVSCSGFRTMSLPFCKVSFDVSGTENSKTSSNALLDSAISILILLCYGCGIMHEDKFLMSYFDSRANNQSSCNIVPLSLANRAR